MIRNPVLPGFNPDPSICRLDGDYYIANLDIRMVSGRPGSIIRKTSSTGRSRAGPSREPLNWTMPGAIRFLRHLGAVPVATRTALSGFVYTDVKRYERELQGLAQLHRHRARHRRPVGEPTLRELVGIRPVAVS